MTKIQPAKSSSNNQAGKKIWLWIFVAMFAVPEILFFTTPVLVESISGKSFLNLSSLVINYGIFLRRPLYLLFIIAIEWIGIFGLLMTAIKRKKLLAIIPFVILVWLSFIFCIVYVTGVSMG